MIIKVKKNLAKFFNSGKELEKKYGVENSKKIMLRIQQLKACTTLQEAFHIPGADFHPWKGNKKRGFRTEA